MKLLILVLVNLDSWNKVERFFLYRDGPLNFPIFGLNLSLSPHTTLFLCLHSSNYSVSLSPALCSLCAFKHSFCLPSLQPCAACAHSNNHFVLPHSSPVQLVRIQTIFLHSVSLSLQPCAACAARRKPRHAAGCRYQPGDAQGEAAKIRG
jgi:hypothetical protein